MCSRAGIGRGGFLEHDTCARHSTGTGVMVRCDIVEGMAAAQRVAY